MEEEHASLANGLLDSPAAVLESLLWWSRSSFADDLHPYDHHGDQLWWMEVWMVVMLLCKVVIQKIHGVGPPLLIQIKRSQLRWFGHLIRMSSDRILVDLFQLRPTAPETPGQTLDPLKRGYLIVGLGLFGEKSQDGQTGDLGVWGDRLSLAATMASTRKHKKEWLTPI